MNSRQRFVMGCVREAKRRLLAGEDVRAVWQKFYAAMLGRTDTCRHLCLGGGQMMIALGLLNTPDLLWTYLLGFVDPQYEDAYDPEGFGCAEIPLA